MILRFGQKVCGQIFILQSREQLRQKTTDKHLQGENLLVEKVV
jgi:hypothetical protein